MRCLLTFCGSNDPFTRENNVGPVLQQVEELGLTTVFLLSTKGEGLIDTAEATRKAIEALPSGIKVMILPVELGGDPINYSRIIEGIRRHLPELIAWIREHDAELFIGASSGTPPMHASLFWLVGNGEIPGEILQVRPKKFAGGGEARTLRCWSISRDFLFPSSPSTDSTENELPDEILNTARQNRIIGNSTVIRQALRKAVRSAPRNMPVLLLGERGSGKELFARFIHQISGRRGKFISVNCSTITESLWESAMFGAKKGAHSMANKDANGFFQEAEGGTIFLDEIGECPPTQQPKLLRAIQEKAIQRVGDSTETKVNVRIIAASNRDLSKSDPTRTFRYDLQDRFEIQFKLPPLRERLQDISEISAFILETHPEIDRGLRLSPRAVTRLLNYSWPGNVRELQNCLVHAAIMRSEGNSVLDVDDLSIKSSENSDPFSNLPDLEENEDFNLPKFIEQIERQLYIRARAKSKTKAEMARRLGTSDQAVGQYIVRHPEVAPNWVGKSVRDI
ncbi:MAG: sigma-54-dependent Fis family transcriptional regulator [Candidatus Riflebacteria bacterium]|nr:sigma-54-dependent Fis family transcriptional regulator [Candidatus Riflebacteria bacterium]